MYQGPSWPWSYGSWIYNYLCNQCLSPLMLWIRISIRERCATLCDKVCQWLATGRWLSPGLPPPIKLKYCWNGCLTQSKKQKQTLLISNVIFTFLVLLNSCMDISYNSLKCSILNYQKIQLLFSFLPIKFSYNFYVKFCFKSRI